MFEKLIEAARTCYASGNPIDECCIEGCPNFDSQPYCLDQILKDCVEALTESSAQLADKDYLIQQQSDEIERLRRDVKKQQEKMFELAKRLPHWVSCEERLPEVGELVVIIDDDGHANTATLSAMGGWWLSNSNDFFPMSRILYWMPLPDPPQEVQ